MPAFATLDDLAAVLGQTEEQVWESGADVVLDLATDLIRAEAKQHIDLVTNDQVELRGTWSHILRLPERPVVDVTAVRIRNGSVFASEFPLQANVDYRWDRMGLLRRVSYITGRLLSPVSGYWGGDMAVVDVTYSHGYAVVPDRIRALCVGVAARVVTNPKGVVRQTDARGPFSTTVQFDKLIPHFALTDHEKKVAQQFRRAA